MGLRLALETLAARAVGALSRAAGRGGGTTLPGKLLWKVDPGAVDALAARLPPGVALVSATNGKTTTTAMAAEILGAEHRLAWNRAGANLLSGVASALVAGARSRARAVRGRRGRAPRGDRADAAARGRAREPLPRPARPLRRARARRRAVARGRRRPPRRARRSSSTRDDPVVADLADGRERALRFGLDDPRHARPALQHAADSKYCVRCGAPYEYAAAYVGHLGDYRCPSCGHARPAARRRRARHRAARPRVVALPARHAPRASVDVELAPPGPLQRLQRRRRRGARARARRVARPTSAPGSSGSARRSAASSASRRAAKTIVAAPDQEPGRRRTRSCGRSRPGVPPVLVVALNDAIADGQDVSWIWDVDFEPLLEHAGLRHRDRRPRRRARPAHRPTAGCPRSGSRSSRRSSSALDRGLELVEAGHRARRPPDVHGDARAARDPRRARPRAPVLGGAAA